MQTGGKNNVQSVGNRLHQTACQAVARIDLLGADLLCNRVNVGVDKLIFLTNFLKLVIQISIGNGNMNWCQAETLVVV